jgi:hypothetical protein
MSAFDTNILKSGRFFMSLMNCPECMHEVSTEAVACPNCAHPFAVQPNPVRSSPRVVVAAPERNDFPKWIIIPVVIVGALIIFFAFALMQNNNEDDAKLKYNVNLAPRESENTREIRTTSPPTQIEIPSDSTTVISPPTPKAPQPIPPTSQTEVINIPTKSSVLVEAKIVTPKGSTQSVKKEKFYLLDKDLETILREADLEPIANQTLSNSFGLAVMYPNKYGDFQKDALNAINKHIKYDTLTNNDGMASMKDVKPDSYYLFGITKNKEGFAIWSSPVTIVEGENKLNLLPARLTEISE